MILLDDVRRTPYVLGGRVPGDGLDCYGVVLVIASRLGLPAPDCWASIRQAWQAGNMSAASGFPEGWRRVQTHSLPCVAGWTGGLLEGDVVVMDGPPHQSCGIVVGSRIWTAAPSLGVYSRDADKFAAACVPQVWRFDRRPLYEWDSVPETDWKAVLARQVQA